MRERGVGTVATWMDVTRSWQPVVKVGIQGSDGVGRMFYTGGHSDGLRLGTTGFQQGLSRSLLNFASGGLPVSAPSRLFYATSATAPSGGASASKAPTR